MNSGQLIRPVIQFATLAISAWLLMSGSVQAGELRIGYVNMTKVMEQAPQAVAALKKLESEFLPRDRELAALRNRIHQLEEELKKAGSETSAAESRKRERELLMLKRDYKRSAQEFREDHNQRRNEELAALQQSVQKAIQEVGKNEKYDLIASEGTLYASDAVDITEKILKKLGKP